MSEENTSGSSKSVRLTEEQWVEAERLHEEKSVSVVDIAERFGVSRQSVHARFKKSGVVRGSKAPKPEPAVDRYVDKRADWIETTRVEGYKALQQSQLLARKIVADTLAAKSPLGAADDDLKAAHRYGRIIAENIKARLELLEASSFTDEDDLPRLEISDLTREEILEHHRATGAIDDHTTLEDMEREAEELQDLLNE